MLLACTGSLIASCQDDNILKSVVADGPAPTASFTYERDFLSVSFTSTSTNAESWYWGFGDGIYSTEQNPVHTYAASGDYTVTLKVNSAAGYSDVSDAVTFYVAGQAVPFFTYTPGFGLSFSFDASRSANARSARWDFGDGSDPVEGFTVSHDFPANGTYDVTVTITGLTDDVVPYTQTIEVIADYNLIRGSDMEASSAVYWSSYSNPLAPDYPFTYTFGYTEDGPGGGSGACLSFDRFNSPAGTRVFVYQPVEVEEGKQYLYSAQVKLPAGAVNSALRFYIAREDELNADGNPDFTQDSKMYFEFSTWSTWGNDENGVNIDRSFAYDGDLTASFIGGTGRYAGGTNGIYTAVHTGTVYIGIGAYTSWADSAAPWLVDDVRFELIVE